MGFLTDRNFYYSLSKPDITSLIKHKLLEHERKWTPLKILCSIKNEDLSIAMLVFQRLGDGFNYGFCMGGDYLALSPIVIASYKSPVLKCSLYFKVL